MTAPRPARPARRRPVKIYALDSLAARVDPRTARLADFPAHRDCGTVYVVAPTKDSAAARLAATIDRRALDPRDVRLAAGNSVAPLLDAGLLDDGAVVVFYGAQMDRPVVRFAPGNIEPDIAGHWRYARRDDPIALVCRGGIYFERADGAHFPERWIGKDPATPRTGRTGAQA